MEKWGAQGQSAAPGGENRTKFGKRLDFPGTAAIIGDTGFYKYAYVRIYIQV